jgi:cytoskeletal protein RodZ
MQYRKKKQNKKTLKKPYLIILAILAVALIAGGIWRIWIYKPANEAIVTAGNPSPAAQPNSSAGTPTPKQNESSNTRNIGGAADTGGTASSTTNSSQWITSKSGVITVHQPLANSTVKSGDVLSGTAKVGTVNFRLIDNTVGVIAEGTLTVVNGKFSGTLSFATHSSSGRLDVYSTDSNGIEQNEIQIAVNY